MACLYMNCTPGVLQQLSPADQQCWKAYRELYCQTFEMSADIAGTGVLVSYVISAGLALIVIVMAYLSDSLPLWYFNELDKSIVLNDSSAPKFMPWVANMKRSRRVAALERFLLALSDQQLVTGLAVLITGIAFASDTKVAEFGVIVSLGWFSSSVHLITLNMLRSYFHKHKVTFYCRLAVIVTVYALLLFANVIAARMQDQCNGVPVVCLYDNQNDAPVGWLPCIILGFFFARAVHRITGLHTDFLPVHHPLAFVWIYLKLTIKKDLIHRELMSKPAFWNTLTTLSASRRPDKYFDNARRRFSIKKPFFVAIYFYQGAFVGTFTSAIFQVTYGIVQMAFSIWVGLGVSVSLPIGITFRDPISLPTGLNFGQLLPLILLGLPCLAALESFYDTKVNPHGQIDTFENRKRLSVDGLRPHAGSIQSLQPSHSSETFIRSPWKDVNQQFDEEFYSVKKYLYAEYLAMCNSIRSASTTSFDLPEAKKRELLDSLEEARCVDALLLKPYRNPLIIAHVVLTMVAAAFGGIIASPLVNLNLSDTDRIVIAFSLMPFYMLFLLYLVYWHSKISNFEHELFDAHSVDLIEGRATTARPLSLVTAMAPAMTELTLEPSSYSQIPAGEPSTLKPNFDVTTGESATVIPGIQGTSSIDVDGIDIVSRRNTASGFV